MDTVNHYYISSGINKSLASDYAELYNSDGNHRMRYKKSKKQAESNWKSYMGSSKNLLDDI